MNSKITLFALLAFICLISCKDDFAPDNSANKSRTLTITANLPANTARETRSITKDPNSLDILLRWEVGNNGIALFFKQGDNVIKAANDASIKTVEQDGKVGTFDVEIPQGIDTEKPFDLYGTTSRLSDVKDGKILAGVNEYWTRLPDHDMGNLYKIPVYFEAKNLTAGSAPHVTFSHLGALAVITVKNASNGELKEGACSIQRFNTNDAPFFYEGFAPFLNLLDMESPAEYQSGYVLQQPMLELQANQTLTYAYWVRPNGNNVPQTVVRLGNSTSENTLPARPALEIGKAYHVYAVWDGEKLTITDDDFIQPDPEELPKITMTTSKAIGETIKLAINAAAADQAGVWIDLNNNGVKDEGEAVTDFGNYKTYTLGAQTVTLHGEVTSLNCSGNQLTALDVSQNTALTQLHCYGNQLTALDVSKNTALRSLNCSDNQLTALDVSQNTALTGLSCYNNQLTALDVSKNTALTDLYCFNNRLTTLDVSRNTALTSLLCSDNQLTALDVSQNTALTGLSCSNNRLTALDITNNKRLVGLDISNNRLDEQALNTLYAALPDITNVTVTISETTWKKKLTVAGNPGAAASATRIATAKGWICDVQGAGAVEPEPTITLIPMPSVANNVKLIIDADPADQAGVWIDFNQNGVKEEIEAVTTFGSIIEYFTYCDPHTLHGKVTHLNCNRFLGLIRLDVSKNTALTRLECNDNHLTALDIANNKQLVCLNISNNRLDEQALNTLYAALPDITNVTVTGSETTWKKKLTVAGNPGAAASNTKIATDKGWIVDVNP